MYAGKNDPIDLFKLTKNLPGEEVFEPLFRNEKVLIERIISTGQSSPPGFWYEQEKDEWVLLLQGEAVISYQNGHSVILQAGHYLFLPAGLAHRVEKTSQDPPCIWLAIFY